MKRLTAREISNYRGLTGKPRRGMLAIDPSHRRLIEHIRRRSEKCRTFDSGRLEQESAVLRERIAVGIPATSPAIVVRAFAAVCEAVRRSRGIEYYDVQLAGGLALACGAIAEIRTGEGKTLITALPAYLHALSASGVHVATTNDYLSSRDRDEVQPALQLLGMEVGLLLPQSAVGDKQAAYRTDITYGPGYEFGFDFLRDQILLRGLTWEKLGVRHLRRLRGAADPAGRLMQRGQAIAIIDEADSVLVDEAMTPLVLSGSTTASDTAVEVYRYAEQLVQGFEEGSDFSIDPERRSVSYLSAGRDVVNESFHQRPPGRLARPWAEIVENALRARCMLDRDVDYVVRDDQVMIVDQNTGRIHDERMWQSGLHQAVEVKEGLAPSGPRETQARVTRQRYSQLYGRLCGMTGTAGGAENEFRDFYAVPVVRIPTHRPSRRHELPALFFAHDEARVAALVADVKLRQHRGQPVLIGTSTIRQSHQLSAALARAELCHAVLNGVQDADEAGIVAQAGQNGRITIATNMAGRGTDIRLDELVRQAGGLHVAAVEFNQSQRIDRQLAGRAARQGDPGSCQFFASADDELIQQHGPVVAEAMRRSADESGRCQSDFSDQVRRIQLRLDRQGFAARRRMVDHDRWLESVQEVMA